MEIKLESQIALYDDATARAFTQIVNVALYSTTEDELRNGLKKISTGKENAEAHHYFEWGFGAHHLWIHQRAGYKSKGLFVSRALIVTF